MKVLCDVHLPYRLVKWFQQQNIEAQHVNQLPQRWYTTDQTICQYADENDYIVITKDHDFRHSHLLQQTPRKLIRITLGNINNTHCVNYLHDILNKLSIIFNNKRAGILK